MSSESLASLWLTRSKTLERILIDCGLSPNDLLIHSDVDVVFVRDPRPQLDTCEHCCTMGEFPAELAAKWKSPTACCGFSAHRGNSSYLPLMKRITQLTEKYGDDQVATNYALDERGWNGVTFLPSAHFPVGGCDTWLKVLRGGGPSRPQPYLLHPNCVDKSGLSKESWLRQHDASLLSSSSSDAHSINETASRRLLARYSTVVSSSDWLACDENTSSSIDIEIGEYPPIPALVVRGSSALTEVADALNRLGVKATLLSSPTDDLRLVTKRIREGHDVRRSIPSRSCPERTSGDFKDARDEDCIELLGLPSPDQHDFLERNRVVTLDERRRSKLAAQLTTVHDALLCEAGVRRTLYLLDTQMRVWNTAEVE